VVAFFEAQETQRREANIQSMRNFELIGRPKDSTAQASASARPQEESAPLTNAPAQTGKGTEHQEGSAEKVVLNEEMLSDVKFPLHLNNNELIVEELGEIIYEHGAYHDAKNIFPVGYRYAGHVSLCRSSA
jgi:hypothetical protein